MRSAQLETEPPPSRASRGELTLEGLDGEDLFKDGNIWYIKNSRSALIQVSELFFALRL